MVDSKPPFKFIFSRSRDVHLYPRLLRVYSTSPQNLCCQPPTSPSLSLFLFSLPSSAPPPSFSAIRHGKQIREIGESR
ncbi:hypothetical protein L6452_02478 [Arctium lappa]|uniref:Uncharacterized protein n=1 Tax=Arctium lappa TaxID=4217 RepID=A0ACB9FKF7_ARCLA|nr:hypothetical protein L6452_02478 [Arctium lappa]